ncbi:MAG: hypothetical protein ABIX28_07910 [Vicinamibacterales bacterium]
MSDLVFPLRHGLLLTLTGEPSLRSVRNFLAAAAVHFKNQRDIQRPERYTAGSFQGRLGDTDGAISHPGDATGTHLAPALWADAVLDAHRRVSALEKIRTGSVAGEDSTGEGPNPAIVALLLDPSTKSHLAALALVLLTIGDEDDGPRLSIADSKASSPDTIH